MLRFALWYKLTEVSDVYRQGILKMEAVSISETSVIFYEIAPRSTAEHSHVYICRRRNLKSHKVMHRRVS
jgi:hypothetical protein